MLSYYPVLILLAPFTAGLIAGLFGRALGARVGRIAVGAEVIALALSVIVLYDVTAHGARTILFTEPSGTFFHVGLYIDRLSAVMLVHIAAISTLIHLFSIRYMQQERGYARFHSLLAFTGFVLFGMVTSANLLMLFLFWQLISWFVPLLSYNYAHAPTVRGAFRTFVMQRAGDVAFLAAVLLAYSLFGTLDLNLQQLVARAAGKHLSFEFLGMEMRGATLIALLIFVAAMSKSAQFPLHMWLPDSLYAPTPVHALLHAGIINAGGFLLARLAPFYALAPTALHVVFLVGMLTALLGSSMMLVQNDIKKTLGYSTIGQMGFMIMECGLGAFGLAIFHLIAHGLFKGSIFLNCGYVIHAARQQPRLPRIADKAAPPAEFSPLSWFTGFFTTLVIPLVILLAAHGILSIPLADSQGATIFLFFGWATSSQAILTMYRLQAVASWKLAISMLAMLVIVALTYLFAAESFSAFLFSAPGEVDYYFRSAALPGWLFDLLIGGFALLIVIGWFLLYARSHGRTIRLPNWVRSLQVRIYLILLNRLYLDGLAMRLRTRFSRALGALDQSKLFPWALGALAFAIALPHMAALSVLPVSQAILLLIAACLVPLFPLHWGYVAAVTRLPGNIAALAALLMPLAGLYVLRGLTVDNPAVALPVLGLVAIFGVFYASLKALAETRVPQLLAYTGCVFFSVFWWRWAHDGTYAEAVVMYAVASVILSGTLVFAGRRAQARLGGATLDCMHGLARPMPRFATLFALLIMAAVGLFPLGLFSSYLEMLAAPARSLSWGLGFVLLSWYLASWYLFRMMQRLFFGPDRGATSYEDLRAGEAVAFVAVLLLLTVLGLAPSGWLQPQPRAGASSIEAVTWKK